MEGQRRLTTDNQQLPYELCHRCGFIARIPLDGLYDGAANDAGVGVLGDGLKLFRGGDAEADRDWLFGEFADAADQILRVGGHLLACTGNPGPDTA